MINLRPLQACEGGNWAHDENHSAKVSARTTHGVRLKIVKSTNTLHINLCRFLELVLHNQICACSPDLMLRISVFRL